MNISVMTVLMNYIVRVVVVIFIVYPLNIVAHSYVFNKHFANDRMRFIFFPPFLILQLA